MQIISDAELQQLALKVSHHLVKMKWTLACAESCTGGWLAKCCTDIAGSSAWFERGFVSYSNQSKIDMLNVSNATISEFGAVSEQTVIEMARGALRASHANISVAITGIAGPSGGSINKPVGTVWLAWATASHTLPECHHFIGDRDFVRQQSVAYALNGIIKNARD